VFIDLFNKKYKKQQTNKRIVIIVYSNIKTPFFDVGGVNTANKD